MNLIGKGFPDGGFVGEVIVGSGDLGADKGFSDRRRIDGNGGRIDPIIVGNIAIIVGVCGEVVSAFDCRIFQDLRFAG